MSHVIKCQHIMSFPAAKGRRDLDDWLSTPARHAPKDVLQKPGHLLSYICTSKKFHRILVFVSSLSLDNLGNVSSEARIIISPLSHVWVGMDHLSPAGKPLGLHWPSNAILFLQNIICHYQIPVHLFFPSKH